MDFLGEKNLAWVNDCFPLKNGYCETEKRMEKRLMDMTKGRELTSEASV